MGCLKAATLLVSILVLLTIGCTAQFYRAPTPDGSCKTWAIFSVDKRISELLSRALSVPCPTGQVVNSKGECVDMTNPSNDRCFTPGK